MSKQLQSIILLHLCQRRLDGLVGQTAIFFSIRLHVLTKCADSVLVTATTRTTLLRSWRNWRKSSKSEQRKRPSRCVGTFHAFPYQLPRNRLLHSVISHLSGIIDHPFKAVEAAAQGQQTRDEEIATGNPLLNLQAALGQREPGTPSSTMSGSTGTFAVKRRWDDDLIFKNQAVGLDDKPKKGEFVNDLLRSEFHKKFMLK